MSRSIDLFIECSLPVDELAAEIHRLTGMAVQPRAEDSTWWLSEGGVEAELRAHAYVNDGDDLLLERYHYALGAVVGNGVRLLDAPETVLLRLVSEALQKGGFDTLLVHDVQYRDPVVHP